MYTIEISKRELSIILQSLIYFKEVVNERNYRYRPDYSELPETLKSHWKNEKEYKKYINDVSKRTTKRLENIDVLKEKIKNIMKKDKEREKNDNGNIN